MNNEKDINDHDLLIELRTEMRGLRLEVKELGVGITTRVSDLEKYKLDIDSWREKNVSDNIPVRMLNLENNKLDKVEAEKEMLRILNQTEMKAKELLSVKTGDDKDHEIRIRVIENNVTKIMTWGSTAVLALGVIQFIIGKYF